MKVVSICSQEVTLYEKTGTNGSVGVGVTLLLPVFHFQKLEVGAMAHSLFLLSVKLDVDTFVPSTGPYLFPCHHAFNNDEDELKLLYLRTSPIKTFPL